MATACETCLRDQLYCARYDAYLCALCDRWTEGACGDASCSYCRDRPPLPSACSHRDPHW